MVHQVVLPILERLYQIENQYHQHRNDDLNKQILHQTVQLLVVMLKLVMYHLRLIIHYMVKFENKITCNYE